MNRFLNCFNFQTKKIEFTEEKLEAEQPVIEGEKYANQLKNEVQSLEKKVECKTSKSDEKQDKKADATVIVSALNISKLALDENKETKCQLTDIEQKSEKSMPAQNSTDTKNLSHAIMSVVKKQIPYILIGGVVLALLCLKS